MGIDLIMAAVMAAAAGSGCSWAHPGANPYRGQPPAALADFPMPEQTRRQLRALMAAQRYTDVVTITRDGIAGQRHYDDLREMHSGHGQLCHGRVDRSAWSATHEERGLVYCVDDTCVIVPTVCNNVSLVTRKPEEGPLQAGADEPIDIAPAAGPPPAPAPADAQVAQAAESGPLDFISTLPDTPGGGGGGGGGGPGLPGGGGPIGGGGGGGGGGGAEFPCCGPGPVGPGGPVTPPVTPASPVPEAPTWALLLAGIAALAARRRQAR
jgi:uncharacterized membrane protein YgcG